MVDANILKYVSRLCTIGGGFDKIHEFQSKAVYIPSQEMLVFRDSQSMVYAGPAHTMYTVKIGEHAQQAYEKLVEDLGIINPEKVNVPDTFIAWAKSLYHAKNPPQEISDLLDVYK